MRAIYILFFLVVIAFGSCLKKDDVPPYIRLNGGADTTILLNHSFKDPGAYAKDDLDGTLDPQTSGRPNTDSVGDYQVTYLATDRAGNASHINRMVHVVNEASIYKGIYTVTQYNSPSDSVVYTDEIITSNITNKVIKVVSLGNVPNSNISINTSSPNFQINYQTRAGDSNPVKQRSFYGSGSITANGFDFNFTMEEMDTAGIVIKTPIHSVYKK